MITINGKKATPKEKAQDFLYLELLERLDYFRDNGDTLGMTEREIALVEDQAKKLFNRIAVLLNYQAPFEVK